MLYNLFENRDFVSVFAVALLAEGVDRNSLSVMFDRMNVVALLAEGVDRNVQRPQRQFLRRGRPPRGGRG